MSKDTREPTVLVTTESVAADAAMDALPAEDDRSTGTVDRLRAVTGRALGVLRREEQWLLLMLLVGVFLCLALGHGFTLEVFNQYLFLFAGKIGYYYMATRLVFYAGRVWRPATDRGWKVKRFVFGDVDPHEGLFKTDLEFIRGVLVLFVSLTVYSNVKLRIPIINSTVGDPFFQKLDNWIFGTELFPWLEQAVHARPWLSEAFQSIYSHDYVYMVILIFLLHLRRDRLSIRWCFNAVAITYVLAILITLAYPSYGPCFVYFKDYQWLRDSTQVGRIQGALLQITTEAVAQAKAGEPVVGRAFFGIAAFPSLHVGHMALLVVFAWYAYRIYVPLVLLMTTLTFVATMAFGWHYAVDGFAGILMAIVIAPVVRKMILKEERETAAAAES